MSEDHNDDGEQLPKRPRKPRSPKYENAKHERGKYRPPEEHQFKSGNKAGRGRPKGSRNKSDYLELLNELVPVGEDSAGRTIKKPIREVINRRLAKNAASGEAWAMKLSFAIEQRAREQLRTEPELPADPGAVERQSRLKAMLIDYLELTASLKQQRMGDFIDGRFRLFGPGHPRPKPKRHE